MLSPLLRKVTPRRSSSTSLEASVLFFWSHPLSALLHGGSPSCRFACNADLVRRRKPLSNPPASSNLALALVLLIVLLLQAGFNAWQDFSTSRLLDSITSLLPAEVLVLRNGASVRIPSSQLVPGDIVDLALGQKVPADLRILNASSDLKFDRSILTGESDPIEAKTECTSDNFLESEQPRAVCSFDNLR